MARPDKAAAVAEITEDFSHGAAVITEYRGLTVTELKALRRALGSEVKYSVVKNTLTKIAAREAGITVLDDLLSGPTAIAFIKGDPVEAAKGLRDFAKAHPTLVIKGGILDSKPMTPDEIRKLADLESREVLLAKLAGAMKGSLSQAVSLFAAPLSQAARLLAALQEQKASEPQPAAEAPAAETTEAPAAEASEAPAEAAEAPAEPAEATETAEAPAETAEATEAPAEATSDAPEEAAPAAETASDETAPE
jgi:large subunit ribosomal protein L10